VYRIAVPPLNGSRLIDRIRAVRDFLGQQSLFECVSDRPDRCGNAVVEDIQQQRCE
jgi:hypothetical protein